jgi:hypothetical protein
MKREMGSYFLFVLNFFNIVLTIIHYDTVCSPVDDAFLSILATLVDLRVVITARGCSPSFGSEGLPALEHGFELVGHSMSVS